MDVVRHYVSVAPLQEGNVSFAYVTEYNSHTKEFDPVVVVTGEYAHRTNVTLRIRKGLPPYDIISVNNYGRYNTDYPI